MALGAEHSASHSGDRSPPSDAPTLQPRRFSVDPAENAFRCPQGKWLHYRGLSRTAQSYLYSAKPGDCGICPVKKRCTSGPYRKVSLHWQEPARQATRDLVLTPAYARSRRERNEVEALFSELKLRVG